MFIKVNLSGMRAVGVVVTGLDERRYENIC